MEFLLMELCGRSWGIEWLRLEDRVVILYFFMFILWLGWVGDERKEAVKGGGGKNIKE